MSLEDKARCVVERLDNLSCEVERCCAAPEDLSPQEVRVLSTVGREGCCIMSGIAGAIRLSLSGVTSLIDRLVQKKLVKRDRSAEDRRVVQVELTGEGRELFEAALEGRVRAARDLLKNLTAEEQDTLVALLGKLAPEKRR